jgi:hypothetical protein
VGEHVVAGLTAGTVAVIDPGSPVVALGFFALIIFHLVLGWKTYRLSRATDQPPAGGIRP